MDIWAKQEREPMTSEELDRIHQRIAERLCQRQSEAHNAACDESEKRKQRMVSLSTAHSMVVRAFSDAREIVREEIERKA